jgi:hypothetical protein
MLSLQKAKEMLQAYYVRVLTHRHTPFVLDRAKPKLPSPSAKTVETPSLAQVSA